MEDGIISTPLDSDITFSDDPLRMLRCVRFATQLNFIIEDETFEALSRNAHRIKIISGERISTELNKIMMCNTPSKGWVDLQRCTRHRGNKRGEIAQKQLLSHLGGA